jgi:hypothetical protein
MTVAMFLEPIITEKSIGVKKTARCYRSLDERLDTVGRGVGNSAHPDTTDPVADFLCRDGNQSFPLGLPTADALLGPAQVCFVNFYGTRQPIPPRAHHCSTQFMQPAPRRFVTSQTQDSLKAQCTRTRLLAGYPPHCSKPRAQRRPRVLENRSGRHRTLPSAVRAVKQCWPRPYRPSLSLSADRAPESLRPAQLNQIGPTGLFGPETCLELRKRLRIIFHEPEHYILWLLESRGYPL